MADRSEIIIVNVDNPATQLVPFKMDGANYTIWSKQLTMVVTSKNKLGFLTRDYREPSVILNPLEHKKWIDHMDSSTCQ